MQRKFLLSALLTLWLGSANAGLFGDSTPQGMQSDCPKTQSRAWCLLDAVNLSKNLSDISQNKFLDSMKSGPGANGVSLERALDVTMITGTAKGWIAPAPGLGRGFSTFALLTGLLSSDRPVIDGANFVLGWMPLDQATDRAEANYKFFAVINEAVAKVTGKPVEIDGTISTHTGFGRPQYSLNSTDRDFQWIDEKWCAGAKDCRLVSSRRSSYGVATLQPGPASDVPAWIAAGKKGWLVRTLLPEPVSDLSYSKSAGFLQAVSANLPAWSYIISAAESPGKAISFIVLNKDQALPIVYNNGKPMIPVFPEVDVSTAPAAPAR